MADLEARLRADGVQIVERPPVDLKQLRVDIGKVREQRQVFAEQARLDLRKHAAGIKLESWSQAINFQRDGRGNLLSADLEFVSVASAFHGATDDEIAAVLSPWAFVSIASESQRATALASVRQMKTKLRALRVVV